MAIRNIQKTLAGMEDLLQGVGQDTQVRGQSTVNVGKLDIPYPVTSIAAMSALDVTRFTKARVYFSQYTATDYVYDPNATEGEVSDNGPGRWIIDPTIGDMIDAYLGAKYEAL